MGTKTIMYDRVVPPGGEFRPRTRVRVRLVAADTGEGTGYNSTDRRTIVGVADELLTSELFVIDLDSTASISAPAGNAYEITRIYPKHPAPPAATFTAPTEPTPTSTTQAVTLPAANIAASTTGFASSGAIYLAGQLVTYTGTTPTAFTGCTGGSGLIASGTAVRQAHWIPDHLVNPPAGLPNLHVDDALDAHDASAVSVTPSSELASTNVQAAVEVLAVDLMRRQRIVDIGAKTYGGILGNDTGNDGPIIQNALNDWMANGGILSGPSTAVCRTTQGLVLPSAATERFYVVNGNGLTIHGIGAIDIMGDTVPANTAAASARTVRKFVIEDFKILGDGSGGAPATTGQRGLVLRGTSLAEIGGVQVIYCDINFDLVFALNAKLTDCFAKMGTTYDYRVRSGMGRVVTDGVLNGTTTLESATAVFTSYDVGKFVSAAGIPPNTTVLSRVNATTVIMSAAATTSGSGVTVTVGSEIHDAVGPNSASNITSLDNCRSYGRAGAVAQFYIYQSGEVSMTNCTTEGFAPVDAIVFDRGGNTTTLQFNINNWHPENAPTNSHLKLVGSCHVGLTAVDWTQGLIMIDADEFGTGDIHLIRCPRFQGKFRHGVSGAGGPAWNFYYSGGVGLDPIAASLWDGAVPAQIGGERLTGGADGFGGSYPMAFGNTLRVIKASRIALVGTVDHIPVSTNAQVGTTYTLALTDAGKVVSGGNAGATTFTVPPNSSVAFAVGSLIEIHQAGAGQITIAPGAGVTLRSPGGKLKLANQYSSASLRKAATDEWVVAGDLTT